MRDAGIGLTSWFRATPSEDSHTFSMHRRANAGAVVGIFVFLILVESTASHVVLAQMSVVLAWLATSSSLSIGLWLFGDLQVTRVHPLRLSPSGLVVEVGLRMRVVVPYGEIALGGLRGATYVRATPLGTDSNVAVCFRRPLPVVGPFGHARLCDGLRLHVDRPDDFIAALRARVAA